MFFFFITAKKNVKCSIVLYWCYWNFNKPARRGINLVYIFAESTLHPFGVELTADRIGKKFSSVTCPTEIISSDLKDSSIIEINEEEDVDIINMGMITNFMNSYQFC